VGDVGDTWDTWDTGDICDVEDVGEDEKVPFPDSDGFAAEMPDAGVEMPERCSEVTGEFPSKPSESLDDEPVASCPPMSDSVAVDGCSLSSDFPKEPVRPDDAPLQDDKVIIRAKRKIHVVVFFIIPCSYRRHYRNTRGDETRGGSLLAPTSFWIVFKNNSAFLGPSEIIPLIYVIDNCFFVHHLN
jgi:hypothetical protein